MNTIKKTMTLALIGLSVMSLVPRRSSAMVRPVVSFQVFYDALSPYGQWVDYPGYGYVWSPDAGSGFVPYETDGRWIHTDYGWTWDSDYSWGWAPFHYGRWMYDPNYGWIWVPGDQWAPAWVAWRESSAYYGWAPLGPGLDFGLSVGLNIPSSLWIFARFDDIFDRDIYHHCYRGADDYGLFEGSRIVDHYYRGRDGGRSYFLGPRIDHWEQNTGRFAPRYSVLESPRPGQFRVAGNQVRVFRPSVSMTNGVRMAPASFRSFSPNGRLAANGRINTSLRPVPNSLSRPYGNSRTDNQPRFQTPFSGNPNRNFQGTPRNYSPVPGPVNRNFNQNPGNRNSSQGNFPRRMPVAAQQNYQRIFQHPIMNNRVQAPMPKFRAPVRQQAPPRNFSQPRSMPRPRAFSQPRSFSQPKFRQAPSRGFSGSGGGGRRRF